MKAKLVKESLDNESSRIDKIVELVIRKINNNPSKLDLSSAFDCAGFQGTDEDNKDLKWGSYNITGITEFKKWLEEDGESLDISGSSITSAAANAYQFILQQNKEFGDYWDGNMNMPN